MFVVNQIYVNVIYLPNVFVNLMMNKRKRHFKCERGSQNPDCSKLSIEELREKFRHVYLTAAKEKQVDEPDEELADEEYLFRDMGLTKHDREMLKSKTNASNLVLEYETASPLKDIDRYQKDNCYSQTKASGQSE